MGTKRRKILHISNPKAKLNKKHDKKVIIKKLLFASFLEITFYWCTFSQFHLQIWNKHKILRFLVPIYLREKKIWTVF